MRLVLLIIALGGFLPLATVYPHVGLLVWGWLTIMQPHREVWYLPPWLELNFVTAVVTIACWLLSREAKLPRPSVLPVLLILFVAWMVVSQLYSLRPDHSWAYFDRDARVMVFVGLALILLDRRTRIHAMVWVLAISIGYYAALGGVFTLATGGRNLVLGPATSMIADNNHLGLAITTVIPLCNYLRLQSRARLVRAGLATVMGLSVLAVFGTQSRGAFIAFGFMCFLWFAIGGGAKLRGALIVAIVGLTALMVMPHTWERRIESIGSFEEDSSFQGRVDAWRNAYDVAKARPFVGAGLRVPYLRDAISRFQSEPREARAAHSIYFEILGSMGFVALGIFLAILFVTWRDLRWVRKAARDIPHLRWAYDLATMGNLSLLTFLVGGAALSLEFWEGFWLIVVFANRTRGVVERALVEQRPSSGTGLYGLRARASAEAPS